MSHALQIALHVRQRGLTCPVALPILQPTTGRCAGTCPVSTFWQDASASCAPCATNCTSCTGPQASQCLSCADGSILKGGECTYGVCDMVQDLGVCLQDDNDNGNTWWPWLLSVILFLLICGTIAWCVAQSRRRRKEATATFAATLDDKAIDRRLAGGIFHILNPNRTHIRTPSREAFLPAAKAKLDYREPNLPSSRESDDYATPYFPDGPPAYAARIDLTSSDGKEPAISNAPKSGPCRAPFISRSSLQHSANVYENRKRPFTNRLVEADGGVCIKEDSNDIPLADRNPFRIV